MRSADDDALMAGMAAGDTASAAVVVRRYQRHVFGVAQAIVGDPSTAEDVAQEAFTRAWHHAGAYDPRRASLSTWLGSITRNAAIDAIRVRRPAPIDVSLIADVLGASGAPDPAQAAELSSQQVVLREALARLPEAQRRAIVLAAIGGRTAAEISELEQIPIGTAKSRIRSGLLRLRDDLNHRRRAESTKDPSE